MSQIIPLPQEYNLTIDQQAANLLLWAKRNPEAARALVRGEAADQATQWNEYRSEGGRLDFTAWMERQEIQCHTCGDHHEPDAVPLACETGDGL